VEVLDDDRQRRYCRIIFAGRDTRLPPHRPMWSRFESSVPGHGSFPTTSSLPWSSVRATSRPRSRRSNRTALRSQARRSSARATRIEIVTLSRQYAGQRRCVGSRTQCARSTASNATASALGTGRRIMAERRRSRAGRGRRYWARARTRNDSRSGNGADASLRAFVRALARQAARECFELELKQRSRTIQ
jgi:hypothetical protein